MDQPVALQITKRKTSSSRPPKATRHFNQLMRQSFKCFATGIELKPDETAPVQIDGAGSRDPENIVWVNRNAWKMCEELGFKQSLQLMEAILRRHRPELFGQAASIGNAADSSIRAEDQHNALSPC